MSCRPDRLGARTRVRSGASLARPQSHCGQPRRRLWLSLFTLILVAMAAAIGACEAEGHSPTQSGGPATRSGAATAAALPGVGIVAPQVAAQLEKPRFSARRAIRHVRALERCGVRSEGSAAERHGAGYISRQLTAMRVRWHVSTFQLPNGSTSRNVIARVPGVDSKTLVLGAHMDSKAPSPGANDNGSGCGVLLDLARCLAKRPAAVSVELVFFGSEEMIDANKDHHHFGSRTFVRRMSAKARDRMLGMISVDMVGYGRSFLVRSMGTGPQAIVRMLLRRSRARGLSATYMRDEGTYGWSDHEAFELAGFPSAWIEWSDDPVYHTTADTAGHVVASKLGLAGGLLLDFIYRLGPRDVRMLGS